MIMDKKILEIDISRAVGRPENPWVPVLCGGNNLLPLVEIRLTDLSKSEGGHGTPAPRGTTCLIIVVGSKTKHQRLDAMNLAGDYFYFFQQKLEEIRLE